MLDSHIDRGNPSGLTVIAILSGDLFDESLVVAVLEHALGFTLLGSLLAGRRLGALHRCDHLLHQGIIGIKHRGA